MPYQQATGRTFPSTGPNTVRAAAVNRNAVYVVGSFIGSDFPTSIGALQSTQRGLADAYLLRLEGGAITYATLLGGSDVSIDYGLGPSSHGSESGDAIVVTSSGDVILAGSTTAIEFPRTGAQLQPGNAGATDTFLARITGLMPVPPPPVPPAVQSLSPFAGSGLSQTFSLEYSDRNGWSDLRAVYLYLNPQFEHVNGCYIEVTVATNAIRLRNDAHTAWLGPSTIGSGGTISNGQCTVNAQASSAFGFGNVFTASLALAFAPSYTGKKRVYMQAVDNGGLSSAWLIMGDFWPSAVGGSTLPTTVNRYRLYNPFSRSHLHTTDLNEYNVLGTRGFLQEGVSGRIFDGPGVAGTVQGVPIYRLYNMRDVRHFWTTDRNEYLTLMMGYPGVFTGEGADGVVLPSPVGNAIPLYRLLFNFSAQPLIHHWTPDFNEYTVLTTSGGWKSEGIAAYLYPPTGPITVNSASDQLEIPAVIESRAAVIPTSEPTLVAVVSGANVQNTVASPGGLMRILGHGLGAVNTVRVDSTTVELVSVDKNEVSFVVPAGVRGKERLRLQAVTETGRLLERTVALTEASPAIFTRDDLGRGQAQMRNEDGTLNSLDQPAARGSVVTFEATGISDSVEVEVSLDGRPAEILALTSSADKAGRMTLTIRVPDEAATGDAIRLAIRAGAAHSQLGVTVAVK